MTHTSESDHSREQVRLTFEQGTAFLTLNRPEKHNAFDQHIIASLLAALDTVRKSEARVLVLAAAGRNFSAGADLNWMKSMGTADEETNRLDALQLARLMDTLYRLPIPTIAAVQGSAFGGALGLICCCDIAVGTDNSRFCLSEVRLGLVPAVISPYVNAAIGWRQMRRYTLTAEVIEARTALELGILHQLTPQEELSETVTAMAGILKNNAPQALGTAKQLLDHIQDHPIDSTLSEYTASQIARLRVGSEAQEGLSAFLEKRTPSWVAERNQSK